jgi:uncharacterized protein (UPF0333 family)
MNDFMTVLNYSKHSQISLEYIIILGFVMIVLMGILGIALFYSGSIKDRIKITQVNNFANKIISTAEGVYYYGEPSKATISVYLPEGIKEISISQNNLFITTQVSSGVEKSSFTSKVPIEGNITASSGIKKVVIRAEENKTSINSL